MSFLLHYTWFIFQLSVWEFSNQIHDAFVSYKALNCSTFKFQHEQPQRSFDLLLTWMYNHNIYINLVMGDL